MKIRTFFSALTAFALCASIFSCTQKEDLTDITPVETKAPEIPSGNRIRIHFGTSTQEGCVYSFSNCIWIGWGASAINADARFAVQFDEGDKADQYFGQYFPLTADYTIDADAAKQLGIEEQVIPAGFYPFRDISTGQATGKRTVVFNPSEGHAVHSLVNPNNPQDNIGQIHNLAVQVLLNENRDALSSLNGDRAAIQKLLTDKSVEFMIEAELPVNQTDEARAYTVDLHRDYSNYAARLNETRLSDHDKKILLSIFDEAASISIRTPEDLNKFVILMTERENQLVRDAKMDNPTVVLSMVSVLKYSRYLWFWKSVSSSTTPAGGAEAASIPDWVWADIIGLELGGPVVSAVASTAVYLDQR